MFGLPQTLSLPDNFGLTVFNRYLLSWSLSNVVITSCSWTNLSFVDAVMRCCSPSHQWWTPDDSWPVIIPVTVHLHDTLPDSDDGSIFCHSDSRIWNLTYSHAEAARVNGIVDSDAVVAVQAFRAPSKAAGESKSCFYLSQRYVRGHQDRGARIKPRFHLSG